jgi:hypothetical protein
MEDGLKNNWKKVGKDFATLGKDFGKTLLKTVKTGVDAATEWVDKEEKNAQPADPVVTEAEQAQADTAKPVAKI